MSPQGPLSLVHSLRDKYKDSDPCERSSNTLSTLELCSTSYNHSRRRASISIYALTRLSVRFGCRDAGAAAGQSAKEWLKGVRLSVHNQKALPDCCTEKPVSVTHSAVDVACLTISSVLATFRLQLDQLARLSITAYPALRTKNELFKTYMVGRGLERIVGAI